MIEAFTRWLLWFYTKHGYYPSKVWIETGDMRALEFACAIQADDHIESMRIMGVPIHER